MQGTVKWSWAISEPLKFSLHEQLSRQRLGRQIHKWDSQQISTERHTKFLSLCVEVGMYVYTVWQMYHDIIYTATDKVFVDRHD